MPNAMGLSLAVIAYALLSAGMVLMKKGIGWIGQKGPKDRAWSRNLITWTAGFLLSNLFVVPSIMALKTLEPHIVAAMAGWGVVALVILSRFWLGEKLHLTDAGYTAVIFLAIVFLNLYQRSGAGDSIRIRFLAGVAFFPLLLFIAALLKRFPAGSRAVLFALAAGISTGLIVVLMKILVRLYGYQVSAYFGSFYLYLYLLFSIMAFIALQLAYRLEAMMRIGPLQYASSIIYPAICSFLVFGSRLHPVQIAAILAMALSSAGILRRH